MSLSANTYRFIAVLVLGLAASLSMPAWAQTCPAGKSEITILTPSGKMKVLCVSDKAVKGIENAADHSGGTVVTTAIGEPSINPGDETEITAIPNGRGYVLDLAPDAPGTFRRPDSRCRSVWDHRPAR